MRWPGRPHQASDHVIWHDLECGGYAADLPIWRELAEQAGGPVLDVGAGSGRVSLDLARRGVPVTALDADAELLTELAWRSREARVRIPTIVADARDFAISQRFAAILVPMQTLQLLGGVEGRVRFLACAAAHLRSDGIVACAIAEELEPFADGAAADVLPDMREVGGIVYSSRPIALRPEAGGMAIERVRERVEPDGSRDEGLDVVVLDRLTAHDVAAEGGRLGLRAEAPLLIEATEEHVGSTVVLLRGPA